MKKDERFVKVYTQGHTNVVEILVDTETGVNYVFRQSGYAGGLTALLDKDGKPVVTPVNELQ
ncbi:DUF6440 family protein [Butyrivibrio sp. YAB3001]|uniref:DUF6440 family protein n=1 Tax=Butyrivibrio sp. YAB3001 TaxID=1520812 RepID=UPI0008F672B9|nr:DUF6440 family protein [Butyrivibrio sp. YAB3001]SFC02001.1 hypothetical protein SAMN02910398_01336 [Butyrivibrio sp. YAB3001]